MAVSLRKKCGLYVVGTGRCGTNTIAKIHNGLHEPEPNILKEARLQYEGKLSEFYELQSKLKYRELLTTQLLSDNRQSFVIPQIRDMNSKAKFIALIREPKGCVESFWARGAYGNNELAQASTNGRKYVINRIQPHAGFPDNWTRFMKCTWYWIETNKIIVRNLALGRDLILFTHELPTETRANTSTAPQKKAKSKLVMSSLSSYEINYLAEAEEFWKDLARLRNALKYSASDVYSEIQRTLN